MSLGGNAHRQRSVPSCLRTRRRCLLPPFFSFSPSSSFLWAAAGSPVGHHLCTLAAEEALSLLLLSFPFNLHRCSAVRELFAFPWIISFLSLSRLVEGCYLLLNPGCDYRKEQVWIKSVQQDDFLWINAFWLWANTGLRCPSLFKLAIVF